MNRRIEKNIIKELRNSNLAIFAGAGLSRGSGFVDWKGLLKDIADELELDINREDDLVSLAQYHTNANGRQSINELIVDEFQRTAQKNENMNILSRLPIDTYWSTNYDSVIEETLSENGKIVDKKVRQNQMKNYKPNRDVVVYKMHGDKDFPDEAVITRDDYESYNQKRALFTTQLKGELISKTFIFIGFSFEDPNLEQILSRVRIDLLGDAPKTHYCFFKEVDNADKKYISADGKFEDKEYNYDRVKQELKISDLKRFGITSIVVKEYSEITEILRDIEKKFNVNKLFISGSAEEYGDWDKQEARVLMHNLSKKMVSKNHHIVSGFGLGVGSFVINGALDEIYENLIKQTTECLTLRPFPQIESGSKNLKELWTEYRIDMIKDIGVAIFIFGNKRLETGEIVLANGMMEEYRIAKSFGKYIIPVGSTGYIAEQILTELSENDEYWYLKDSVKILKDEKDVGKLICEVEKILEKISNGKV